MDGNDYLVRKASLKGSSQGSRTTKPVPSVGIVNIRPGSTWRWKVPSVVIMVERRANKWSLGNPTKYKARRVAPCSQSGKEWERCTKSDPVGPCVRVCARVQRERAIDNNQSERSAPWIRNPHSHPDTSTHTQSSTDSCISLSHLYFLFISLLKWWLEPWKNNPKLESDSLAVLEKLPLRLMTMLPLKTVLLVSQVSESRSVDHSNMVLTWAS